jgi:hypothetical protein
MFGQKTTFGAGSTGGGFGTFGSTAATNPFGTTTTAFGQQVRTGLKFQSQFSAVFANFRRKNGVFLTNQFYGHIFA